MDIKEISTQKLIEELNSRGFKTQLLYNLSDVDMQLDGINEDRDEDNQIKLDSSDKEQILDEVFESYMVDVVCERINSDIEDKILDYEQ